jgi:hypothetical protein
MPFLIRTIGSAAPDLLQIISDPPPGSKNLVLLVGFVFNDFLKFIRNIELNEGLSTNLVTVLGLCHIQVLHVLTESSPPSPELITAVKQLYESKMKVLDSD